MRTRFHHTVLFCFVLLAGAVASACDNSVDPFIETDRYFTLWGYLDTASDTQFVRVIPFRRDVGGVGSPEIDAEVTAVEEETGRTFTWKDSVVTYGDGTYGHVFYSAFRPIPGFTYRFHVDGPDGAESWAETAVPLAEHAEVGEPRLFGQAGITQIVTWDSVSAPPFRVEVWYRFARYPPYEPFKDVVLTYQDTGEAVDGGWRVVVNLSEDAEEIHSRAGPAAQLLGVGMRLTMSDEAWRPPGGVFDEELLVQPGTFSNVKQGYGFLGSVNHYAVEWVVSDLVTRRLDFGVPR